MSYSRTLNHFTSTQDLVTIWASGTSYLLNQLVIQNDFIYRCTVSHVSAVSFQTDQAAGRWNRVSSAENGINWISSAYYVVDQLVIESNTIYQCLVSHTSSGSFIADFGLGYWVVIAGGGGGGATGGGSDAIFFENDQTVNFDYTITTNKNALSAGPITIASGVTVTIPSGSVWTIV